MPRMSHPEQSASRKVSALTDFEYRVWEQTKLSSDDFGVMPYTPTVIRADNVRLRKASDKHVLESLEQLVALRLLIVYAHQDERYACAPQWQKWQQVRFPRKATRPPPPPDILAQCEPLTVELFRKWPGGRRFTEHLSSVTDLSRDNSDHKSGVHTRLIPANANANANALSDPRKMTAEISITADRPERDVWDAWRTAAQAASHVVLRLEPNALEYGKLAEICHMVPDSATRMQALAAFWALDERECAKRNIKLKSLGYFVMALPGLLDTGQSEDAERAKFLAGTR